MTTDYSQLTDTPEARRQRQQRRREQLNEIARRAGYETWSRLETGAIRGDNITIGEKHVDNHPSIKTVLQDKIARVFIKTDYSADHAHDFVIETESGQQATLFSFDSYSFRTDWERGTFEPEEYLKENYKYGVGDIVTLYKFQHDTTTTWRVNSNGEMGARYWDAKLDEWVFQPLQCMCNICSKHGTGSPEYMEVGNV